MKLAHNAVVRQTEEPFLSKGAILTWAGGDGR